MAKFLSNSFIMFYSMGMGLPTTKVQCAKQCPENEWAKMLVSLQEVPVEFEPKESKQTTVSAFMIAKKRAEGTSKSFVVWTCCVCRQGCQHGEDSLP